MPKPAPTLTPGSFETLVAEHENAAGLHYINSSTETLERLEKAREALLAERHGVFDPCARGLDTAA